MMQERRALCEEWRHKVQHAKAAYDAAKAARTATDWDYSRMPISDSALDNRQALKAETAALLEYRRVLLLHHRLVVDGVRPEEAA